MKTALALLIACAWLLAAPLTQAQHAAGIDGRLPQQIASQERDPPQPTATPRAKKRDTSKDFRARVPGETKVDRKARKKSPA